MTAATLCRSTDTTTGRPCDQDVAAGATVCRAGHTPAAGAYNRAAAATGLAGHDPDLDETPADPQPDCGEPDPLAGFPAVAAIDADVLCDISSLDGQPLATGATAADSLLRLAADEHALVAELIARSKDRDLSTHARGRWRELAGDVASRTDDPDLQALLITAGAAVRRELAGNPQLDPAVAARLARYKDIKTLDRLFGRDLDPAARLEALQTAVGCVRDGHDVRNLEEATVAAVRDGQLEADDAADLLTRLTGNPTGTLSRHHGWAETLIDHPVHGPTVRHKLGVSTDPLEPDVAAAILAAADPTAEHGTIDYVLTRRPLPDDVLERWAEHATFGPVVRDHRHAAHARLCDLERRLTDGDGDWQTASVLVRRSPDPQVRAAAIAASSSALRELAVNPHVSDRELVAAYDAADDELRRTSLLDSTIRNRPELHRWAADQAAGHRHFAAMVASRTSDPHVLAQLADDAPLETICNLATSPATLERIATTPGRTDEQDAAINNAFLARSDWSNLTEATQRQLASAPNGFFRGRVASLQPDPQAALQMIASDPDRDARRYAAQHPGVPPEVRAVENISQSLGSHITEADAAALGPAGVRALISRHQQRGGVSVELLQTAVARADRIDTADILDSPALHRLRPAVARRRDLDDQTAATLAGERDAAAAVAANRHRSLSSAVQHKLMDTAEGAYLVPEVAGGLASRDDLDPQVAARIAGALTNDTGQFRSNGCEEVARRLSANPAVPTRLRDQMAPWRQQQSCYGTDISGEASDGPLARRLSDRTWATTFIALRDGHDGTLGDLADITDAFAEL